MVNSDILQKNGVEVLMAEIYFDRYLDILQDNILQNLVKKDKNYKNVRNNLVEHF